MPCPAPLPGRPATAPRGRSTGAARSESVSFDVPHWCHRKCFAEIIQTEDYDDVPLAEIVPDMFDGHDTIKKADKVQ